jgi:hypothetical protein
MKLMIGATGPDFVRVKLKISIDVHNLLLVPNAKLDARERDLAVNVADRMHKARAC